MLTCIYRNTRMGSIVKNKAMWALIGFISIGWLIGDDDNQATTPRDLTKVSTSPTTNIQTQKAQDETKVAKLPETTTPQITTKASSIKETPMYVDASRLNVRNGPSTENKQIWTLKRDQRVATYQREGDWVFVKGQRFEGWVHGGYLTPNKSQPKPKVITKPKISDNQIAKQLIARSIGLYRGACPCPYNRMRNGRRCGSNSAYSRPGGASPLCYASDITPGMISDYRSRL
jgi:uncharacterized protein YraI